MLSRLFFLYFFSSSSILSDDVYRFWWDGRVQAELGINPYSYAPRDFPAIDLKTGDFERINHPSVPTVYGPFLELLFYLSYLISPSIYGIKLVFIAFELLSVFVLILLLRELRLPRQYFIIYALNPLVFLEIYSSVHTESVLAFFLILTLYFRSKGFLGLSLLALAFLSLTKYIAIIFLPLYFIGFPLNRVLRGFLLYFVVVFGFYLLYFDSNMFSALLNYTRYWEFNGSLYNLVVFFFEDKGFSRLIMGLIFLLLSLVLYIMYFRGRITFIFAVYSLLLLVFMLSPVLYPWYIVMFLPLLSIYFSRAILLFSGLLVLSYMVLLGYYASGLWDLSPVILLLEYLPFYFLLAYDFVKNRRLLPAIL